MKMPRHCMDPKATFTNHVMMRFHEVNKHYDGTLNDVYYFLLLTETSSNEVFTYKQAMQQKD